MPNSKPSKRTMAENRLINAISCEATTRSDTCCSYVKACKPDKDNLSRTKPKFRPTNYASATTRSGVTHGVCILATSTIVRILAASSCATRGQMDLKSSTFFKKSSMSSGPCGNFLPSGSSKQSLKARPDLVPVILSTLRDALNHVFVLVRATFASFGLKANAVEACLNLWTQNPRRFITLNGLDAFH